MSARRSATAARQSNPATQLQTSVLRPVGAPPPVGGPLDLALWSFKKSAEIDGKGRLSQMVFLSRTARDNGLPLDASTLLAPSGGQVKGASGRAVGSILADYGITRILSSEGGRTSRGSLGYLPSYISKLNELHGVGIADTAQIEAWWVERVKDFFNATPFALRFDPSKNMRVLVRDLLSQAEQRQREAPGTMFVGAMLQHLVGAKLELCLPGVQIQHYSFSTADAPGGRSGDFLVNNAAIHVTTAPSEALMARCRANLETGNLHPVIVTTYLKVPAAVQLAENAGIHEQVEVFDIEQFVSTNLLELGGFLSAHRHLKVSELVAKYNAIVHGAETDHSLKIGDG